MNGLNDDPKWLDAEYVKKILTVFTNNTLNEIKSFTKKPATVKGENFASAMHLVTVDYTTSGQTKEIIHTTSLIVKSRLENEMMSTIEEDFNIFHRESQVYTVIMGQAEAVLRSIGDETIFGPRAVYVDDLVIVQENLKSKGYCIDDVKRGLNYEQCYLILEKLAKFHATSMVLYRKNPEIFKHHLPGNLTEAPNPLHALYRNCIRTSIDYCKVTPSLQQYVPNLEAFSEKIIAKMINVFIRNQTTDRFHVLNHGDVWVNNMMFRKDPSGKRFEDVLFVDYQEGYYGSPGIDWNYFIFSSWQPEVFINSRDSLIECYHRVLADVLRKLNYEQSIPTVDDVRKEILNKAFHGLATATCLTPILINERKELLDPMNFLMDSDEAKENRKKIFDNPKYGKMLEIFLEFFKENSIL